VSLGHWQAIEKAGNPLTQHDVERMRDLTSRQEGGNLRSCRERLYFLGQFAKFLLKVDLTFMRCPADMYGHSLG
jgi:hypothetical protein